MVNFIEVTEEYQDGAGGLIGVIRDNWLDEQNPTYNNGLNNKLWIGDGYSVFARQDQRAIIEIQMPTEEDVDGFGVLVKVELWLKILTKDASKWMTIGIVGLDEIWDEGDKTEGAGWANWTESQSAVLWVNGNGAIKSRVGSLDDMDTVIDAYRNTLVAGSYSALMTAPYWGVWDLTPSLSMGDKKTFVLFDLDREDATNNVITFGSNEQSAVPSIVPILKVTYRDYAVEAFDDNDDALTIEPNPNDREQPLLKWGGVDDGDFVDFKLYRDTVAITTIAGLSVNGVLVTTIADNSDQEYIDVSALVDGTTYYYAVIAEDGNNTGDGATFSKNVNYTKPDVATGSITTNSGAKIVGVTSIITVTSGNLIKRVYIDWKDGTKSWYDYETTALSQTASHTYSGTSGALTPDIRVEDNLGFWSDLTASSNTITLSDSSPSAKLRVSVKKETLGDDITLDGSLSQPIGDNVTITKYEFMRDAADGWQDNGADPVYTFDSGTYPNTVGSKTASLRITVPSLLTDTDTATYELETGTPTDLKFSKDTKIHELNHILSQNKLTEIAIGSDGVEHEFFISKKAERINLVGTSNHPNTGDDIGLIRSAWNNNTYVRILAQTEMEDHVVQYDCKIDGDISLGQSYDNKQSWSFPIRVMSRKLSYAITGVNQGTKTFTIVATLVTAPVAGDKINITDSSGNNGEYTVASTAGNTNITVDEAIPNATVNGTLFVKGD